MQLTFPKTPPLLLGAALLFWGWQNEVLFVGASLAVLLESARLVKARWELSDEDFTRVWIFCTLAALATTVYAFSANEGPSSFRGLFQDPSLSAQNQAGTSSARTAIFVLRWLPVPFLLFILAQTYSSREGIPLETIALILRRRWQRASPSLRPGKSRAPANISYPYFVICLFAASAHGSTNDTFFWGVSVLLIWALWPRRSLRFAAPVWLAALGVSVGLGYFSEVGLNLLQRLVANYNPEWFSGSSRHGFDSNQNRTEIGQIGRVKTSGKIVVRLATKESGAPPVYLREASFRLYNSGVWHGPGPRDEFTYVPPETNNSTWILLPAKINVASVNLACYLDGGRALLPLPTGTGRLENLSPFTALKKNTSGAVQAEGPGLEIFDAFYGPGLTLDAPPPPWSPTNDDYDVPVREAPAVSKVVAGFGLPAKAGRAEALQAINHFFADFKYSVWQDPGRPVNTNLTPLARFLLKSHHGHCEYFATATVLLLRQCHIPARYAVGYSVHEGTGNRYVVRQRDAHAWCLVWNEKDKYWQDFDTTPATWVAEENKRASSLQSLSDFWSWLVFQLMKLRWGQTHLRQYILISIVPALAFLLYQILFRKGRSRHHANAGDAPDRADWPGLDSEFYELEQELARRGGARQPGEPLSVWLPRAAAEPALASWRPRLLELLRLHYRHRFDPLGLNRADREKLRAQSQRCLVPLAEGGVPKL